MRNWRDLSFLRTGTNRQREAWDAIHQSRIMEYLQSYDPVLAGTIPLDIDVKDSDLDIICTSTDLDTFDRVVRAAYGDCEGYQAERVKLHGHRTSIISFYSGGFLFELFAQFLPVHRQNAYRHMDIEARLLAIAGTDASREIRLLKQSGLKTEPAFTRYFNIPGEDSYQALLEWECMSDEELKKRIQTKTS